MKPYGIIYRIVKNNEIVYIGKTKQTFSRRMQKHISLANRGKGYIFHQAIRKYGIDSFIMEEIASCLDRESLNASEIMLIAEYKPRYNITKGGEDGFISKEHYDKLSKMFKGRENSWSKGRKHTEQSKQLMLKNRQLTDTGRNKLRAPKSEETRAKMSLAQLKRYREAVKC